MLSKKKNTGPESSSDIIISLEKKTSLNSAICSSRLIPRKICLRNSVSKAWAVWNLQTADHQTQREPRNAAAHSHSTMLLNVHACVCVWAFVKKTESARRAHSRLAIYQTTNLNSQVSILLFCSHDLKIPRRGARAANARIRSISADVRFRFRFRIRTHTRRQLAADTFASWPESEKRRKRETRSQTHIL
jgi:hypothetical protein